MAPKKPVSAEGGSSQGPSTDAAGTPVVDPTSNVFHLVDAVAGRLSDVMDAGFKRMDDLREADAMRMHDMLAAKEHDHRRLDELMDTKVEYIEKMNGMRDLHAIELREAEANRLNAIRAVDVGAVSQASSVAATQATILAGQVATSAETMRAQVAAAATAAATSLSAALEPMQRSIDDLRRAQYEAQGQKTNVVETQARGGSNAMWIGLAVGAVGLMMSVLFSVVGIVITLILANR